MGILTSFFLYLLVTGASADEAEDVFSPTDQEPSEECMGSTVYRSEDPVDLREFKAETSNCVKFRWEFDFEKPKNASDLVMVNIDELKLAEGVFLDVFDYILQDGVRKTLHRASISHLPMHPLPSAWNTGTLVVFEKQLGTPVQAYFKGEFFLHYNKMHHCPYPFIKANGKGEVRTQVFSGSKKETNCALQINSTAPLRNIRLSINASSSIVNIARNAYRFERPNLISSVLFTYKKERLVETSADSVMIHVIARRGQQTAITYSEKTEDDCHCWPASQSISPGSQLFLVTPLSSLNKTCARLRCETSIHMALTDSQRLNGHYSIRLMGTPQSDYQGLSISDRYDPIFQVLSYLSWDDVGYTPSLSSDLKFAYISPGSSDFFFNVTVSVVDLGEGCQCGYPRIDALTLNITMPAACKAIDCEFTITPKIGENETFDQFTYTKNNLGSRDFLRYCHDRAPHRQCIHFSSMAGNTVIHAPSSWGRNATIWWHRAYQEDSDDEISPVDAHFELSHQILRECSCPFSKNGGKEANVTVSPSDSPLLFLSPNHPERYCQNMNCVTRFIAPPGHHIRAHAITVDLEPPHDRLFFLEGADALRGRHLDTFTGEVLSTAAVESGSQVMTALFMSDASVAYSGFNFTIGAVPNDDEVSDAVTSSFLSGMLLVVLLLMVPVVAAAVYFGRLRLQRFGPGIANPILFFNDPSRFAHTLEKACIETIEEGKMRKDLAICIYGVKGANKPGAYLLTQQYLDAVDSKMAALMSQA